MQKAIDQVAKECTTLVIAHRLTTIRNADKIVVIERGKIVEKDCIEPIEKKSTYYIMNQIKN